MEDQLIDFKTAKLAKRKGFKEGSDTKFMDWVQGQEPVSILAEYNEKNPLKFLFTNSKDNPHTYERPTQSLLQKWLREVHHIDIMLNKTHIDVNDDNTLGYFAEVYDNIGDDNNKLSDIVFDVKETGLDYRKLYVHLKYEDALEIGLQEALNLIK